MAESENQYAYEGSDGGRTQEEPKHEEAGGKEARDREIEMKNQGAGAHQDEVDGPSPCDPHHQRTEQEVANPNRCHKTVLYGLAPDVIEQGIGHIELTDLNGAHCYDPNENKGLHFF